jgi:hypothetical protein
MLHKNNSVVHKYINTKHRMYELYSHPTDWKHLTSTSFPLTNEILTEWTTGLFKKLTLAHLVNIYPAHYGIRKFLSFLQQSAIACALFWARCIQSALLVLKPYFFKINFNFVLRFEVFTTVTLKNAVFWDVAPCRSCVNRRFGGTYRLHFQGREIREWGTSVSRCKKWSGSFNKKNKPGNALVT